MRIQRDIKGQGNTAEMTGNEGTLKEHAGNDMNGHEGKLRNMREMKEH